MTPGDHGNILYILMSIFRGSRNWAEPLRLATFPGLQAPPLLLNLISPLLYIGQVIPYSYSSQLPLTFSFFSFFFFFTFAPLPVFNRLALGADFFFFLDIKISCDSLS